MRIVQRREFLASASALLAAPLLAGAQEAAQLREAAARDGAVRVVLTLAIAGPQPPSEGAIRAAQERLIAALAGARYENLHRSRHVAQISMTAGRDALEILLSSPLVAAVAPDSLAGTMTPPAVR